jgi:hypothetical protein
VTFIEHGVATSRTIASNVSGAGQQRFTAGLGPAGRRTIVALVYIDGWLRSIVHVAHYRAPAAALVGVPAHASYSVAGRVITVSWGRAMSASSYSISVFLADHRRVGIVCGGRARSESTLLPSGTRVRSVEVSALNHGLQGKAVRARRSHRRT